MMKAKIRDISIQVRQFQKGDYGRAITICRWHRLSDAGEPVDFSCNYYIRVTPSSFVRASRAQNAMLGKLAP